MSIKLSLPAVTLVTLVTAGPVAAQSASDPILTSVSGSVTVLERDGGARDVGQSVVWLEGASALPAEPDSVQIITVDKEFAPRVVVVTTGSVVTFPNNDPFNHNVFSLSSEGRFDLGLYGRGEGRGVDFPNPGIIKVYCNVHPGMSGYIHVRDNPHFAQPSGDGSFVIEAVPPGRYTLKAWHERADSVATMEIAVGTRPVRGVRVRLDARGYEFEPHLNKYGRPYSRRGRRY